MTEKEQHKVHFGAEVDTFGKDNDIVVSLIDERKVSVHLGFLKLGYRYEVSVLVPSPDVLIDSNDMINCKEPNVNCKINRLDTNESGLLLNLDILAYKEKLMREEVCIIGRENEQILTLQVLARVLGKNKGTPLLKNGIKCLGLEITDEESEASDWQGF